jgi:hypothetical protein
VIEITAVSFGQARAHEHITAVLWRSACTSAGHSAGEALIAWLEASSANQAVVADTDSVHVAVVRSADHPAYIRAQVDGVWTDDLLALPEF